MVNQGHVHPRINPFLLM